MGSELPVAHDPAPGAGFGPEPLPPAATTGFAPDPVSPVATAGFTPEPLPPVAVPPVQAGPATALIEVLERDGHVRQSFAVARWPVAVGRSLANDVVLSEAHIAATHLTMDATDAGLQLTVGDTRNGVAIGGRLLRAGESATFRPGPEPFDMVLGRTRLRLRLPQHPLAPELAVAPPGSLLRRTAPVALAGIVLLAGLLLQAWLDTDPDALTRTFSATLMTALVSTAIWCGMWAVLSKTFTRQAHFGWHLRVFVLAALAWALVNTLAALLAFSLSWPWLTDFAFIGQIAVGAAALYFHLLAVEPARPRLLRWAALGCAASGVALTLWFNVQRTDLFGDELYMNHLFPPALRLARPVPAQGFVDGLRTLKAPLDRKAREPGSADDARAEED